MNCIKNGKFTGDSCFGCEIDAESCDIRYKLLYRPRWIPVDKQTPKSNVSVLIFAESTTIQGGTITMVGACHNGFWFIQSSQDTLGFPCRDYKVIAWMPLPEPYKPD